MKISKKFIPLFWPSYSGKDIQIAIKKLFPTNMKNRWLGEGPVTKEFEKKFGDTFNYKYCLSVNSGSAALELAYHLIGISEGDEVITPVLTCTATTIPLYRRKAKIIFADCDVNLVVDPEDVTSKITKKTKAIVVVTLGGLPVDKEIFKVAKQYNVPVVIDAAQSVGVSEKYGDYICYSFQAIKHFCCPDGGMLVLRNKNDYNRAKKLRWFGIDREAKARADWQPFKHREMTMDIEEAGYKFHMNDVAAAIGLCGLKYSDKWLKHRKMIGDYYKKNIKGYVITGGSYWLTCIIVENRDKIAEYLKDNNIDTNMVQLRNDIFKIFGGKKLDLPNINSLEDHYLYIPINTYMTLNDAKYITKKVNEAIEKFSQ